jgi:mutator protein MutT
MTAPIPVVAGCVVRPRSNEVLLAQRYQPDIPDAHLKWELPGGKIKFCELPEDTIVRELLEEIGLAVQVVALLPHVQTNIWNQSGDLKHTLIICFECHPVREVDIPAPRDRHVSDVNWFHIDEIDWDMTLPGTREFVGCLIQAPRGTTSEIYVRLEKYDSAGRRTHFYEIYQAPTLEGAGTEMIIREASVSRPNPRQRVGSFRFQYKDAVEELRRRLKTRLNRGYVIKDSQPSADVLTAALGL